MVICQPETANLKKVKIAKSKKINLNKVLKMSELFSVLGDPTRIEILNALSHGELCICEIVLALGKSQSLISHQLRALRHLNLVKVKKEGRNRYYSLNNSHILNLLSECKKTIEGK
ncbi:MAG: metalloregulator ArsR/SmtB family transcription factor [Candidatus Altiarchaeota archaeon]